MPKALRTPYAKTFGRFAPTSPPRSRPARTNGLSRGVVPSSLSRRTTPVRWASSGSGPPYWSSGRPPVGGGRARERDAARTVGQVLHLPSPADVADLDVELAVATEHDLAAVVVAALDVGRSWPAVARGCSGRAGGPAARRSAARGSACCRSTGSGRRGCRAAAPRQGRWSPGRWCSRSSRGRRGDDVGNRGCTAMPSSPRSDAELTGRSSTSVTVASPDADSRSRFTLPVAFSRTSTSSRPMNAALVGCASPLAAVRTCRAGSTTDGGDGGGVCCAVAEPATIAVRTSGTAAVHHLLRRI